MNELLEQRGQWVYCRLCDKQGFGASGMMHHVASVHPVEFARNKAENKVAATTIKQEAKVAIFGPRRNEVLEFLQRIADAMEERNEILKELNIKVLSNIVH